MKAYDSTNFVSPCCKAFNYYNGNNVYCSRCGKIVKMLKGDETLTVYVKFNNDNKSSGGGKASGDVVNIFHRNAKRFAHDPTCELIKKQCPECKHGQCRYLRDPQDTLIFVCEKCRHVFNS